MCDKLFLQSKKLKTFTRNHIGEKLYNCSFRGRAFQLIPICNGSSNYTSQKIAICSKFSVFSQNLKTCNESKLTRVLFALNHFQGK